MRNITSLWVLALGFFVISFFPVNSSATADPAERPMLHGASDKTGFAVTFFAEGVRPVSAASSQESDNQSKLKMVIIKTRSSHEVEQLRRMRLDIVRVKSDPSSPPNRKSLSGGFIVEAVTSKGMLKKLKAMGFEVYEASAPRSQP
ncbi:MAG: hypothetical protein JSW26_19770 [Desulfobacterales bacterium]|nr:MAG: hypothetical protein JSW26_19770 [Desulfobacterales bacterium]